MTYAFTLDARYCSGCKACQTACKDKNHLPAGVLWRRVLEVTGGSWQQNGAAWNQTVFAYNLTISCNHCLHPKCAGVCPASAYVIREDGIVLLDEDRCTGCGYCAWACPYEAPQYNPAAGHMGKCNFCFDEIELGRPPACVAACPLRVLDYREQTAGPGACGEEIQLWEVPAEAHPYPLPVSSHTRPRLAITPHAAMKGWEDKFIANLEEIQPRRRSAREELPLMLFTLLAQAAVGLYWASLWISPRSLQLLSGLLVGACLGLGMLASLAHLGTKRRALNMLRNLRRSWLSREILFAGLFGAGWLVTTAGLALWQPGMIELRAVTATLGLGLIYSMAQVYRLPAVPTWNTWQTNAGFVVSTVLLGQSATGFLLAYESSVRGLPIASSLAVEINSVLLGMLVLQLVLTGRQAFDRPLADLRNGLILLGIVLVIADFLPSGARVSWMSALILLIVLLEESLGRWMFYRARSASLADAT